ncbi:MAG: hypothetical protein BGO77_07390 [Caedibacter sp. 37-49]|nr:MAG: hypothetical protein BGO77_07390 [Caedibacter sp. 37-49]
MDKDTILGIYLPYMKAVKQICLPFLNQYNFNHFWYTRFYSNGSFIDLGINENWFEFMLDNNHFNFWNEKAFHPKYWPSEESKIIYTPFTVLNNFSPSNINFIVNEQKVYYSFNIIANRKDYLENFGFSAPQENIHSVLLFSKYFGYLKSFGIHFSKIAADIIDKLEKQGRIHCSTLNNNENILSIDTGSLFKPYSKSLKHYYIISPRGNIAITQRQKECLSKLAQGKCMKEIANDLLLSPKTVDAHLIRVKDKAGLSSRAQLIDCFLRSGL